MAVWLRVTCREQLVKFYVKIYLHLSDLFDRFHTSKTIQFIGANEKSIYHECNSQRNPHGKGQGKCAKASYPYVCLNKHVCYWSTCILFIFRVELKCFNCEKLGHIQKDCEAPSVARQRVDVAPGWRDTDIARKIVASRATQSSSGMTVLQAYLEVDDG